MWMREGFARSNCRIVRSVRRRKHPSWTQVDRHRWHVHDCKAMWPASRFVSSETRGHFRKSQQLHGVTIVHDQRSADRALSELQRLKDRAHAWDTEASDAGGISRSRTDWRSPVTHGRIICATCFCGDDADFGNGPRLFIDNDGPAHGVLNEYFKEYFENTDMRKVFHNYSFDRHLLARHDVHIKGFHADTLHMARFFDTSLGAWEGMAQMQKPTARATDTVIPNESSAAALPQYLQVRRVRLGGSTLERKSWSTGASMLHTSALEKNQDVGPAINGYGLKSLVELWGLTDKRQKSFQELFGGHASAAEDAHNSAEMFPQWVDYATDDAVMTYRLFQHLHAELASRPWLSQVHRPRTTDVLRDKNVARNLLNGGSQARDRTGQSMFDFFNLYMRDFAECLADLEQEGIGIDCEVLRRIEEKATRDVEVSRAQFAESLGAARGPNGDVLVADAHSINFASPMQLRTLLFGGAGKNRVTGETLAAVHTFPALRTCENVSEANSEKNKKPKKKTFDLKGLALELVNPKRRHFTEKGDPSAATAILEEFAGNESQPGVAYSQLIAKGIQPNDAKMITDGLQHLILASKANKALSGFVRPILEYGKHTERIHPQWKFDTSTGRLACRNPNLQNLPIVGTDRYKVRSVFRANPGNVLVIADYSQLELKILAHMANSGTMIDKLRKGGDYHSEVAAEMFDHVANAIARREVIVQEARADGSDSAVDLLPTVKEKFGTERKQAKAINFGIIFGKEPTTLGEDLGIKTNEAEALIERWFKAKPEVQRWRQGVMKEALEHGRVVSLLGRWRNLPLISQDLHRRKCLRAAVNYCIQGSAADVVIGAMLRIWKNKRLSELGFRLVMQVHDEFVLEGPQASANEASELVRQMMSAPFVEHAPNFKLRVPLTIDVGIGPEFSLTAS